MYVFRYEQEVLLRPSRPLNGKSRRRALRLRVRPGAMRRPTVRESAINKTRSSLLWPVCHAQRPQPRPGILCSAVRLAVGETNAPCNCGGLAPAARLKDNWCVAARIGSQPMIGLALIKTVGNSSKVNRSSGSCDFRRACNETGVGEGNRDVRNRNFHGHRS